MPDSMRKVMVVEDTEDYAFLLSRALNHSRRFQIVWRARDRKEAISYLAGTGQYADRQRFPYPDAVLLDLRLPQPEDGFEVLDWIVQQKNRPKVVMMSVLTNEGERARALHSGADEFKVKPYEEKELGDFVRWLDEWIGARPAGLAQLSADGPRSQSRSQKRASPGKPRPRGSARDECEADRRRRLGR